MEEWKTIPDYEDFEASTLGRIRRRLPGGSNSSHVGRLRTPQAHETGYLYIAIREDGKTKNLYIHKLILLAFCGPPSDGQECAHFDGNKHNNRLENLRWATRTENSRDKIRHGTSRRGLLNPMRKLSPSKVKRIRALLGKNKTYREISAKFSVSQSTIWKISSGKCWGHVQ